ncbi:monovalent cation/H+ antiporter subunit D [Pseudomonas sp. Gutcm_11s]|uniref:monovalent cation/H+ antiporter subunit D n=1 Tax=Pseudomonas sp. Gutcm_11s TaxID=3026088 RepID=UPI00235E208D|nr:monovalent cation/H+ antiporter subunit D [Pseudomonas sp. Gutcm_11s]MDD0844298.1 monovalent cation/H+ antiporter subunit D [Pseudomonas sp. Gutcm_11s]
MNHLLILPILLPMLAGALLLVLPSHERLKRGLSLLATLTLVPVALALLQQADDGQLRIYALGDWRPPFGIVLLLDRLSALLLLAAAVLGSVVVLYALRGDDRRGPRFHALLQFQLLGINGSFLTGDLFNLFVFFEVLLIASYALLLYGRSAERVRAGLHYVILNLTGSALFLIALGLIYGVSGTLNMADLSARVAAATGDQVPLLAVAGALLLLVFALKAALLPLYFWLPRAYAAASAPVAALFAIMTKVGVYAILRVCTLIFGDDGGELAQLIQAWLWPLALATVALGAIGALAARSLPLLLAYMVLVSAGTLLAAVAIGTPAAHAAALYYLLHSTWVAGGLFLLADLIGRQRGSKGGDLVQGPALENPMLLGGMFFFGAVAVIGLPPLSGFLGKLLLLRSEPSIALWGVLLLGGFAALVAFSRAGSTLFWRVGLSSLDSAELDRGRLFACVLLLACSLGLVVLAAPLLDYSSAAAAQLHDVAPYRALIGEGRP